MKKTIWKIIFIIGFVTSAYYFSKIIVLRRAYCESQYTACSPRINTLVTGFEGKPFFDSRRKLQKVLADEPSLANYSIRYSPLSNLNIYVIEKKGDVAIKKDEDQNYQIVTKFGEEVVESQEAGLPKITVKGGPIFPDEIRFTVEMVYEVSKYYGIKEANLSPDGIEFEYKGYTILLPTEGDIDTLLGSIDLTLSWLNTSPEVSTIEGVQSKKTVDFRYKNPVVR